MRGNILEKPMMKAEIIESIHTERQALYESIVNLLSEDLEKPGVVGEWSVKDLLAHLTAWEQLFLAWYADELAGKTVHLPVEGMTWEQIDELNQMIFEEHREKTFETVRGEAETSFQQILDAVEGMTEEVINQAGHYPWLGKHALSYLLRECTDIHYKWARELVTKWVKES